MRAVIAFVAMLLFSAQTAQGREPILGLPIDCILGDTCFIQSYVDTDPGDGYADFTCGPLSYDGHKGTDFALPTEADMWAGVDVIASAPGTVLGTRDGMEDHIFSAPDAPDITGKECGNGVLIDHGGNWHTQYCHLMKGSVRVKKGDRVSASTVLGQVGLSGRTEFPHVHMSVRHNGKVVDPFNPTGVIACGQEAILNGTLWDRDMVYRSGAILSLGVSTDVPSYESVKAGTAPAENLTSKSIALVIYGYAYGGRAGDVMRLTLFGPEGEIVSHDATLSKDQAQFYRAVGKKNRAAWPLGGYSATVQMIRAGIEISTREERFRITE